MPETEQTLLEKLRGIKPAITGEEADWLTPILNVLGEKFALWGYKLESMCPQVNSQREGNFEILEISGVQLSDNSLTFIIPSINYAIISSEKIVMLEQEKACVIASTTQIDDCNSPSPDEAAQAAPTTLFSCDLGEMRRGEGVLFENMPLSYKIILSNGQAEKTSQASSHEIIFSHINLLPSDNLPFDNGLRSELPGTARLRIEDWSDSTGKASLLSMQLQCTTADLAVQPSNLIPTKKNLPLLFTEELLNAHLEAVNETLGQLGYQLDSRNLQSQPILNRAQSSLTIQVGDIKLVPISNNSQAQNGVAKSLQIPGEVRINFVFNVTTNQHSYSGVEADNHLLQEIFASPASGHIGNFIERKAKVENTIAQHDELPPEEKSKLTLIIKNNTNRFWERKLTLLAAEKQLKDYLGKLKVHATSLNNRGYTKEASTIETLTTALEEQITQALHQPQDDTAWLYICKKEINKANKILSQHRGYKGVANIIVGIIAGLTVIGGLLLAIKAAYSFFATGGFTPLVLDSNENNTNNHKQQWQGYVTGFFKTTAQKKADTVEEAIEELAEQLRKVATAS